MVPQRLGNSHQRNAEILSNIFQSNSHIQSIPRFENQKKRCLLQIIRSAYGFWKGDRRAGGASSSHQPDSLDWE